jgi:hypothetical protein
LEVHDISTESYNGPFAFLFVKLDQLALRSFTGFAQVAEINMVQEYAANAPAF